MESGQNSGNYASAFAYGVNATIFGVSRFRMHSEVIINTLNELQECEPVNKRAALNVYICNSLLFYARHNYSVVFFADNALKDGGEGCNISAKNGRNGR